MYEYKAKVLRVVDGDSYILLVDLGFGLFKKDRFRLYGADTPETWRPSCDAEKEHGELATAMVKFLIEDSDVTIKTFKDKQGKYGRYLCDIILEDGSVLSGYLEDNDLIKRESY